MRTIGGRRGQREVAADKRGEFGVDLEGTQGRGGKSVSWQRDINDSVDGLAGKGTRCGFDGRCAHIEQGKSGSRTSILAALLLLWIY